MARRTFGGDAKAFGALSKDLSGAGLERTNREVGTRAKQLARQAASVDLGGDPKFSGWAPTLDTKYRSLKGSQVGVVISPTRVSAGPWTVAQRGRNQGETGAVLGPGVNRKTGLTARTKSGGVRKVRAVQAKRWNGATAGKGTASDAVVLFRRELLPVIEKGIVQLTRKHLGG